MRAVSSDGAVGAQFGDQVPLGNDKVALAAPGSRPWGVRPGSAGVRGSGVEGSLSAAVTRSVLVSSSPLGIWPHSRPSVLQTPSSGSLSHIAIQGPLRSGSESRLAKCRSPGDRRWSTLGSAGSVLGPSLACPLPAGPRLLPEAHRPCSWGSRGPWGWMGSQRGDALAAQTAGRDTESGVCTQGSSSHPRGLRGGQQEGPTDSDPGLVLRGAPGAWGSRHTELKTVPSAGVAGSTQ